jgi:hypothetical protein
VAAPKPPKTFFNFYGVSFAILFHNVTRRENHNDGYKKESSSEEGREKSSQKEVAAEKQTRQADSPKRAPAFFLCPRTNYNRVQ